MAYEVKILADSVSPAGHRLTTTMATFPRFILAEVNTTRMFERSSASSRAIPVEKKIRGVEEDMFVPAAFGKNQKGMQHSEVLTGDEGRAAEMEWREAGQLALGKARVLAELGVHKQYANRVLEPYAWHTAIITATDWSNHEHLRVNPDAQGEYQVLARMMKEARDAAVPRPLNPNEWHLPLVTAEERIEAERAGTPAEYLVKLSVARCARVSYLTHEGKRDPAEDVRLYGTLATHGHMSPLGHAARPMDVYELRLTEAYDVSFESGPTLRMRPLGAKIPMPVVGEVIEGRKIVRVRGPLHYAGPLNGWLSQRSMIHGEEDIHGYRMGLTP